MQEYIDVIQQNLTELYNKLDKQLSLEHTGFDIDYKDSHYSFYPPTTPREHKEINRYKKIFIKRLLKDALRKSVDAVADGKYDAYWDNIICFDEKYLSTWDTFEPSEASQPYEVIDFEDATGLRAKTLDIDSQYVFMQRQDLTPEMLQEFFQNKFKNTFDSEPQHATITPEDSIKIEV